MNPLSKTIFVLPSDLEKEKEVFKFTPSVIVHMAMLSTEDVSYLPPATKAVNVT